VDHNDARFVVAALESRITGDRVELDRLAETSVVRLAAAASRLKGLGVDWPPALLAALELETIVRYGAKAADGDASPDLKIFVDKLSELVAEKPMAAGEPPPRNRAERRRAAAIYLPRRERVVLH
jgi:hypothetical protein